MTTRVLRRADHTVMPWRNGAGVSREIARHPLATDDWDWRLSFADVERGGAFSAYPGVDRVITLVRGGRMRLRVGEGADEREVDLAPFERYAFAGESPVECAITEPSVDFNVMVRRAWGTTQVRMITLDATTEAIVTGERAFLVVLAGEVEVQGSEGQALLGEFDVLQAEDERLAARAAASEAVLAIVCLLPQPE